MKKPLPNSDPHSSANWKKKYLNIDPKYNFKDRRKDVLNQMVIYRSNRDDSAFDQFLEGLEQRLEALNASGKEIRIISMCGTCDESLMLLNGSGIELLVTTEAASMGNATTRAIGVTGEQNGIYYSANYYFNVPKELEPPKKAKSDIQKVHEIDNGKMPVKVAVLDTGLLKAELQEFIVGRNNDPCITNAFHGWNFTVPNYDFNDDHDRRHGTTVSRMLINQSLSNTLPHPVKIIPVKVHDAGGACDLYDILCALAYAQSMGAHIINASFGYYAPLDYSKKGTFCVELFRAFISDVLTKKGILLIAAAGNKTDRDTIYNMWNQTSQETPQPLYPVPDDTRDLDQLHFFPGSFAGESDLWNVISVTTVDPGIRDVSPMQNFSKNVVDIGVPADEPGDNGFSNPRIPDTFIAGSSFATPKVAGMIAGNYHLIAGKTNKNDIINILKSNRLLDLVTNTLGIRYAILRK